MTLVYLAVIFGPLGLFATFALCLCVVASRSDRAVAREYQRRQGPARNTTVKGGP